ncbi:hypothetical protein BLNAU_12334 [Blattamonas nauphoetae]|uniref:Uncharacterized protein n=1 Tax=Blattamonas nauphoetae TaxID=2049346 RepID=A0ABQ9XMH0_9EUKA|nr:hypothetical protein BLNAU_12334 [Blattamonas nauphoetae]
MLTMTSKQFQRDLIGPSVASDEHVPHFASVVMSNPPTIAETKESFNSLVDWVRSSSSTERAYEARGCAFLDSMRPPQSRLLARQIVRELCPSTDGSCAGFVDSISILLGSAFPKLGESALHLLDATLRLASDDDRIRVAESSLLSQVLPKFMHYDLTTSASVPMCLIRIVMTLLELSIETRKMSFAELSEEAVVGIDQTVFDNVLVPSAGFVLFLFRQRYSVSPREDFLLFAGLLSTLFQIAKSRASASTHAFPLPLSLLLTDCLVSLEPTSHIHSILLIISDSFRRWTNDAQEETKMQQGAFRRDAESERFEDIAESLRLLADVKLAIAVRKSCEMTLDHLGGNQGHE